MTDTSRFLITTSDERSWDTEKPVLFLGEWCRLYNRESAWKSLDSEVCPEYGRNNNQQIKDFETIGVLYKKLVHELTQSLNSYHSVDHSERYWKILIGPWLYRFITILFNRWFTIKQAVEHFNINHTYLFDYSTDEIVPLDMMDFNYMHRTDEWNHVIYGMILSEIKDIECEKLESIKVSLKIKNENSKTQTQKFKKYIINNLEKLCSKLSKENDAFIISPYIPFKQHILLQLAFKQFPMVWHSHQSVVLSDKNISRKNIFLENKFHHGFVKFIREQIINQMPTAYVEGYNELQSHVDDLRWPKSPKVIFTANSFESDEIFKSWAASKVEKGVPYVVGQHGTYYGMNKYDTAEYLEIETADRFLTWGWEGSNKKYYPACALTCVGDKDGGYDPSGGLLLVELHVEHRDTPWDSSVHYKKYINNQFEFVNNLKTSISNATTIRLYGGNDQIDWGIEELWEREKSSIMIDDGTLKITKVISENRLTVFSYNSTGLLENLARNIPTIIFLDLDYYAFRKDVKQQIDSLINAGIMFEDPVAAALKINEVWGDIYNWWNGIEVQNARIIFCDKFARKIDNEIFQLKDALSSINLLNDNKIMNKALF